MKRIISKEPVAISDGYEGLSDSFSATDHHRYGIMRLSFLVTVCSVGQRRR